MAIEILFTREFWEERKSHREKIVRVIREFIKGPSRDKLIELVGEIWALRFTYKDLDWYVNERVLKYSDLNGVAKAFDVLLNEDLPLEERLKIKIPGFGSGAVSEILFSVNPEKYPVYNRKFVIGAKKLGYQVGHLEHVIRLTPDTLNELIRVHEQIFTDFSELREEIVKRTGFKVPRFDFTDGMLWKVAQDEIPTKEALEWRKPKRITALDEVDLILKALGKGVSKYVELVNEGEREGTALEKAAFYTEGILEAYGVDRDDVSDFLESLKELLNVLLER